MEISVLTWNVCAENERTVKYLEHVLGWLRKNRTAGADIDFILLQETRVNEPPGDSFSQKLEQIGYHVEKVREQSIGRGDCYLIAAASNWQMAAGQYLQVWDPHEFTGVTIRSPYSIVAAKEDVQLEVWNFHNAFCTTGVSEVCVRNFAKQIANRKKTIVAGDFNVVYEDMPEFVGFYDSVYNNYDHILVSDDIWCIGHDALDNDEAGKPLLWQHEDGLDSINGSDHCAIFGQYEIF